MDSILGSMTFNAPCDEGTSRSILSAWEAVERSRVGPDATVVVDTAHMYGVGDQKTETMLGALLAGVPESKVAFDTKVNCRDAPVGFDGTLGRASVRAQLTASLDRVGRSRCRVLYLHWPDNATPLSETLTECGALHKESKFVEFGISNYPAWELASIWHMCERDPELPPPPSIYQGMYNAVTRHVEEELFPCLRRLGMRFVAYNPLAGGMLTNRYRSPEEEPQSGRFKNLPYYRPRYWRQSMFEALAPLREGTKDGSLAQVAMRWLRHHSQLDPKRGDAVIIGASSAAHASANVEALNMGPLDEETLIALDAAEEVARIDRPKYFR